VSADLKCLDRGFGDCRGPVELRTTPDRTDGRHFPRCEHHFEERLTLAERFADLRGDVPPPWLDPGYAGERWDED
jgi:hypothetical protein